MRDETAIEKVVSPAAPPEASRHKPCLVLPVIDTCADGILLVVALLGELGIVFANVLARIFFSTSFLWADEVARFVLSIIAFIGGAVAYRRREHAFVRVLLNRCPAGMQRVCFCARRYSGALHRRGHGVRLLRIHRVELERAHSDLPDPGCHDCHPADRGIGTARLLCGQPSSPRTRTASLGGGRHLRRADGGGMATRDGWLAWFTGDNAITATVALFFVAILAGVPGGFVLLAGHGGLSLGDQRPLLVSLPQSMVNGTGNYILLAVPFFIFAGLIMERGGISLRLVRFVGRSSATCGAACCRSGGQHVYRLRPVRLQGRRRCRRRDRDAG